MLLTIQTRKPIEGGKTEEICRSQKKNGTHCRYAKRFPEFKKTSPSALVRPLFSSCKLKDEKRVEDSRRGGDFRFLWSVKGTKNSDNLFKLQFKRKRDELFRESTRHFPPLWSVKAAKNRYNLSKLQLKEEGSKIFPKAPCIFVSFFKKETKPRQMTEFFICVSRRFPIIVIFALILSKNKLDSTNYLTKPPKK